MLKFILKFLLKLANENEGKYQGKSFHVNWTNATSRVAKCQIPRFAPLTAFIYIGNNLISTSMFYELLWAGGPLTYIKNEPVKQLREIVIFYIFAEESIFDQENHIFENFLF